ncbi:MAG TPA: TetR/AcrR family transcriptional regulator [Mycobacteriales bacterium]|nr:TetR/AcrR family transcriptional regulator [Mycobacteriales bacterium]
MSSQPARADADPPGPRPTRAYDSALRRQRAAETHDRIVAAGAELVHTFSSWDWRKLTIRAVAERAGVHERTVYRHFATEDHLRTAVIGRLEQEAGLQPHGITIEGLPEHVDALFAFLSRLSSSREPALDASLAAEDERRKAGLLEAVRAEVPDWDERDQALVASLLDVLLSVPAYRRFASGWNLEAPEATRAVTWLLGLMADALRDGRSPDSSR